MLLNKWPQSSPVTRIRNPNKIGTTLICIPLKSGQKEAWAISILPRLVVRNKSRILGWIVYSSFPSTKFPPLWGSGETNWRETSIQPGFDSTNFPTLWGCAMIWLKPVHSKWSIGNFQDSGKFTQKTYSGSQKSEVCPMPYALCPMPYAYALCPMPYAHEYLIWELERLYITPQTKDMKPIHTNAARLTNKTVKPDLSDKDFFLPPEILC